MVFANAVFVAAGASDLKDRLNAARDGVKGHSEGKHSYGFPALAEMFGKAVAKQAADWLGYSEPVRGEESDPDEPSRGPALDTSDLDDLRFPGNPYLPEAVPGVVGEVIAHILETSLYPVPDFAALSAMVFASEGQG